MAKKSSGKKKLIGVIFLALGILLLIWGFNEAGSVNNKLARAFAGSPSDRVLWFYISGGVCSLIGFFNLFKK